ncbi:hypothetical protein Tco_1476939 [Tanacetum coccineum]
MNLRLDGKGKKSPLSFKVGERKLCGADVEGESGVLIPPSLRVTDMSKMDKNEAKRTKSSTGMEKYKKSKPKAYTSLMGQPVPILLGQSVGNEWMGLEDWDAPQALDPSSLGYK